MLDEENTMKHKTLSRREFIEASLGALAAPPLAAAGRGPSAGSRSSQGVARVGAPPENVSRLSFRGLFMYAWDLRDGGADSVMGWMRDSGLNAMCLAATYHSGWLVRANNPRHRAFMTEGSVAYFPWHKEFYRNTRLHPLTSRFAWETDWLHEAVRRLDKYGLRLVAWTIGTHNTRLGLEHPECTVQNVYSDSLPHALCPANDEVREYLKGLCRDLAVHYPLWGMHLESFGWGRLTHGHHHERDLTGLAPLEQELMALCVCPWCRKKADAAGIDVGAVGEVVKTTLDATFREAPDRSKGHPRTMAELEAKSGDLAKFNAWRRTVADSLVREIKAESLRGTSCRMLVQGGYREGVDRAADGFSCSAYGKSPAETLEVCRQASRALPADWKGELHCLVRLGMGVPHDAAELRGIVESVRDGGCSGLAFYNFSDSPPKMLGWVKRALRDI
jgi:hypothetical protein